MNFEKVYEKYLNGTATEEERQYIEQEIQKARKLSMILDEVDARRVIQPAEQDEVKTATKRMKKQLGLRVIVITLAVLLAVTLFVSGTLFAYVNIKASSGVLYDKAESIELAKKSVNDHSDAASSDLVIVDVERDLRFDNGKISRAYYVYEIEVRKGVVEYEVEINTHTGKAVIVDVDN